jgi:hypothetical protein
MHSSPTSMAANKLRPACPFLRLRALSCARIRQHCAPAVRHRREIHVHRVVHLCRTAAPPLPGTNGRGPPHCDQCASPCTSHALIAPWRTAQLPQCAPPALWPGGQHGNDSTARRRRSHPCPVLYTAYCLRHGVATLPVAGCERARR